MIEVFWELVGSEIEIVRIMDIDAEVMNLNYKVKIQSGELNLLGMSHLQETLNIYK